MVNGSARPPQRQGAAFTVRHSRAQKIFHVANDFRFCRSAAIDTERKLEQPARVGVQWCLAGLARIVLDLYRVDSWTLAAPARPQF